jgi:hypothetical protein
MSNLPDKLPPGEGPGLQPFSQDSNPNVTFVRLLGQGMHSCVLETLINDEPYALKVVNA